MIHLAQEELYMSDHYWLSVAQVECIKPYFPLSHGVPRVDGPSVLSGIIHVLKQGRPVPAALRFACLA